MSLHGSVKINGRTLSEWSATRITNDHADVLDPDDVSTYHWQWMGAPGTWIVGELDHRYGDGAEALAAAVLSAAVAARKDTPPPSQWDPDLGAYVSQEG